MGVFPSGQWGQTVNLLLSASVVRIHPRPPNKKNPNLFPIGEGFGFFVFFGKQNAADALDVTMAQRPELDYLIYNDPLGYADLILNGDPEEYLKNVAGSHGLED